MDLSRQAQIMSFDPADYPMLVIGAGGIGSNAVYVSACMGFEHITVYEPDVVSEENIAPQFYGTNDMIDTEPVLKTNSLRFRIVDMTGVQIKAFPDLYHRQPETAKIVLVAVDSMPARRRIWRQNHISGKRWWIDGRMGGTLCSVYCVDLENEKIIAEYEKSLEQPQADLPCGMKATAFLTKGMIQGMIGSALYHIVTDGEVPFKQIFDAKTMWFGLQEVASG